ncbi:MAG: ATP-binding protein [Bifidobacteriaceae bacterium]|nr:ATP-binding protein [Bifidobacteriaceae bacterium]
MPLIPRPLYTDRIMKFADSDLVKVLVGLRRSGKSRILQIVQNQLKAAGRNPGHFIELNFEDYALRELTDPDKLHRYLLERINNFKEKETPYIFLDGVQEVRDFEKVIDSLRTVQGADIYITGSNSRLLSKEISTHLSGRYVQFAIYPFGYREFLEARKALGSRADFQSYIELGGMPQVAAEMESQDDAQRYLTDIQRSVILKDIVERYSIRDAALLERLIAYAFENAGNVLSANSVSRYLKSERVDISVQTVLNYLEYSRDAFILQEFDRTEISGKERLRTQQKYFPTDHSFRNLIVSDPGTIIQGTLENIVALEGLRRGYTVTVGTINKKEVDFVFTRGKDEKRYIQVSYLLSGAETADGEFAPLEMIPDNYPKTVVSMDALLQPRGGIEHRNIEEFLLAEDW